MRQKTAVPSNGGAVWCLALSPNGEHMVAGCEDGGVRLYGVDQGRLAYTRTLDMHDARVLSVAWHPSGTYIAAGNGASSIRKVSLTSGRSVLRISVGDFHSKTTLVWALVVLQDDTIVSGDSTGHVQFWNGVMGTLQQQFRQHTGDVLAVVCADDERSVYASGVDNKIVEFRCLDTPESQLDVTEEAEGASGSGSNQNNVNNRSSYNSNNNNNDGNSGSSNNVKKPTRWMPSCVRRAHTHDVRALALYGNSGSGSNGRLVSGGIDTNIIVYPLDNFKYGAVRKLPPFPQTRFTAHLCWACMYGCVYVMYVCMFVCLRAYIHVGGWTFYPCFLVWR